MEEKGQEPREEGEGSQAESAIQGGGRRRSPFLPFHAIGSACLKLSLSATCGVESTVEGSSYAQGIVNPFLFSILTKLLRS